MCIQRTRNISITVAICPNLLNPNETVSFSNHNNSLMLQANGDAFLSTTIGWSYEFFYISTPAQEISWHFRHAKTKSLVILVSIFEHWCNGSLGEYFRTLTFGFQISDRRAFSFIHDFFFRIVWTLTLRECYRTQLRLSISRSWKFTSGMRFPSGKIFNIIHLQLYT